MRYGAYIKTWTGNSTGYPPNGGGGGLGYAVSLAFLPSLSSHPSAPKSSKLIANPPFNISGKYNLHRLHP